MVGGRVQGGGGVVGQPHDQLGLVGGVHRPPGLQTLEFGGLLRLGQQRHREPAIGQRLLDRPVDQQPSTDRWDPMRAMDRT
jgi:hypothetical protein